MSEQQWNRQADETIEDYFYRLCEQHVENNLTWRELTELYNKECNLHTSISSNKNKWYRIRKQPIQQPETKVESVKETLTEIIHEIKKERVKLRDESTQNNAIIRRISREETVKEIGIESAKLIAQSDALSFPTLIPEESSAELQAILELSDWHYGICINNAYNVYNPEIAKQRLQKLTQKVINKLSTHNIKKLYVVNLSDLISGRIHLQLRINSRFDVITQIMHVSELLAHMLHQLSNYVRIEYYDCDDNHSRVEPSKSDSLELETLTRITHWFLKERLKNNPNVSIRENDWGQDIITFNILGHNVAGVHGDHDTPSKVLDNITLMTRQSYDLCCVAHRHHFAADEKNCCVIVSNGSLMGTDDYAEKLRLSANPSQNLIFATRENVCECIHRILV